MEVIAAALAVCVLGALAWDAWRRTLAVRRIDDRAALEARMAECETAVLKAASSAKVDAQLAEVAEHMQALRNAVAMGGSRR